MDFPLDLAGMDFPLDLAGIDFPLDFPCFFDCLLVISLFLYGDDIRTVAASVTRGLGR